MFKQLGLIAAGVATLAGGAAQAQGYRAYRDRGAIEARYDERRAFRAQRCRSNGGLGTVLGAIVGGLLGDAAVGRRGDDTAGAIAGAGVGALAGRAIERGGRRC